MLFHVILKISNIFVAFCYQSLKVIITREISGIFCQYVKHLEFSPQSRQIQVLLFPEIWVILQTSKTK